LIGGPGPYRDIGNAWIGTGGLGQPRCLLCPPYPHGQGDVSVKKHPSLFGEQFGLAPGELRKGNDKAEEKNRPSRIKNATFYDFPE
jgi:hypothetical protein